MIRPPKIRLVAPLCAALVVAVAACGSDDASTTPTTEPPATGVLEGMEHGLAAGSTTAVPLDLAVVTGGEQASLTTPAPVLAWPGDGTEEQIVIEVEPVSLEQGSVDDFAFEADDLSTVDGASVWYLTATVRYVNGFVAQMPNLNSFDLYAGDTLLSGDIEMFTYGTEFDACVKSYEVESFGEGAEQQFCSVIWVTDGTQQPTSVRWTGPAQDAAGLPPTSWPVG